MQLAQAVRGLCGGYPSKETQELQEALKESLSAGAIYLYGTNLNVEIHNYEVLPRQPGHA